MIGGDRRMMRKNTKEALRRKKEGERMKGKNKGYESDKKELEVNIREERG